MNLAILAPLIIFTAAAEDYFPLEPGLTWEYSVTLEMGLTRHRQTHRTLPAVKVGESAAVPMEVRIDGKPDSTAFYRADKGYIHMVALHEDEPLAYPVPVFPLSPKAGEKWEFNGATMFLGASSPAVTKYRVVGFEQMPVLGSAPRNVLKLESETTIGSGRGAMKMKSTEHYAAGIGLVQRKQEVLSDGGGSATFVLIRFEAGGNR